AHLDASVQAVADANQRSGVRDGVAKSFLRFANREGDRNRKAALARAAKRAITDDLCSQLHVGVGQNNDVVFCATLTLHALAAGSGARVNMFRNGRGTDET